MKLHIDSEVEPPFEEIAFLEIYQRPAGEDFFVVHSPDNKLDGEYITPVVGTQPFKYIYSIRIAIANNKAMDFGIPETYFMVIPDNVVSIDDKQYLEKAIREKFRCYGREDFFSWLNMESEIALSFCKKVESF